ncbi:hypothetical protein [Conexibacter woesei]|uniref:hypothetical protein n=1 Tax=Conexibacter woesei TaxID=191495 RepID=UPI000406F19F|nr:hypothetical protein [Conexibacter woesei]
MHNSIVHRPLRVLGLALAATLAWAALAAGSAHALTGVVCGGSESGTFSPSLTNTPAPTAVAFTQNYGCVSPTDPAIRSGLYSSAITAPATCALVTTGATRTRLIRWNTGETSSFTFTSTVRTFGNLITARRAGTITAGKFAGATANEQVVGTADLASCDGAGASRYSAATVLTITAS